jgi:hypothetical protein
LIFAFLLCTQGSLLANGILEPFTAKYDVYRNDQHVADSHFKLQHKNDTWTWRMSTKPWGLFKWLTEKKPFTETQMSKTSDGYLLSKIASGEYRERPPEDNTWFDQKNELIYYSNSSSQQKTQLPLPKNLYSYHDVHLLYEKMKQSGQSSLDIHFYRTGNVFKSTLTLERGVDISHDSKSIRVDKMTQQVSNSSRTMVYYYQGHSLAPLKIVQFKEDKPLTSMWRSSLESTKHEKTSTLLE